MSTPSSSLADTTTTATGWYSVDRKRKERDGDNDSSWKTTLPLGWTRMQKSDLCPTAPPDVAGIEGAGSGMTRPRGMMSSRNYYGDSTTTNSSTGNNTQKDPSSSISSSPSPSSSSSSTKSQACTTSNIHGTIQQNNHTKIVHGQAIFCLHDWNPSWIQGYFLPSTSSSFSSSSPSSLMKGTLFGGVGGDVTTTSVDKTLVKPWRMLGVQEEIDECLECTDGGYRRLTLTVYQDTSPAMSSATRAVSDTGATKRLRKKMAKTTKFHGIEWTGGDMMDLYDVDNKVDMMKAEKLLTGHQCLRPLNKYFGGLISHLRRQCLENDDDENGNNDRDDFDVLEFLPNLAIVIGSMSLTVPNSDKDDGVDDDLFDD